MSVAVASIAELMKQANTPVSSANLDEVDLSLIEYDPNQPRKTIDSPRFKEIVATVKSVGVVQPIVLRPIDSGRYIVVAGERRCRAAKKAGLKTIPATIRDLDTDQVLLFQLVENIARDDLLPWEEAEALSKLRVKVGSQSELAKLIGKSDKYISQRLALLDLPDRVMEFRDSRATMDVEALVMLGNLYEIDESSAQELLNKPTLISRNELARRIRAAKKGEPLKIVDGVKGCDNIGEIEPKLVTEDSDNDEEGSDTERDTHPVKTITQKGIPSAEKDDALEIPNPVTVSINGREGILVVNDVPATPNSVYVLFDEKELSIVNYTNSIVRVIGVSTDCIKVAEINSNDSE